MSTTLEILKQARAGLPDLAEGRRRLLEDTMKFRTLTLKIETVESTDATIAEVNPQLVDLTTCRDVLNKLRERLCEELLAQPPRPRTDHDLGVLQNLKLSIYAIDHGLAPLDGTGYSLGTLRLGGLLREAGIEWQGSLSEVGRQIKQLTKRRNDAERQREDALLDDDERQARLEAARKIPTRKCRGDGTSYDQFDDGRQVEVPPDTVPGTESV